MATTKKPVAMCCVNIGYRSFLLPADKGMKLVELMQSAVECDRSYGVSGHVYVVQEQPEVSLEIIKPAQVRKSSQAGGMPDAPRLIE